MSAEKKNRRRDVVAKSLLKYISGFNAFSQKKKSNTDYVLDYTQEQCAAHAAKIVWYYDPFRTTLRDVVVHGESNPLIDRHKIIAGKQTAIMSVLPLRVKKYAHITEHQLEKWYGSQNCLLNPKLLPDVDRPFVETIRCNALFAFSLGVDILCIWNKVEQKAPGFIDCNGTLSSCYSRLLLNTFRNRSGNPAHDSTFFWCSHLWFTLERNLLYWSKYGVI